MEMQEGWGAVAAGQGLVQMSSIAQGKGGPSGEGSTVWADTHFPGGTVPAAALLVLEGGQKVVGGENWMRESSGNWFSAAGFAPLIFFPELADPELPVSEIMALTAE